MRYRHHPDRRRDEKASDASAAFVFFAVAGFLAFIIYLAALAVGIVWLLFPLVLVFVWEKCHHWSKNLKTFISILVLAAWIILLPSMFDYLGSLKLNSDSDHQPPDAPVSTVLSPSPLPISPPTIVPEQPLVQLPSQQT